MRIFVENRSLAKVFATHWRRFLPLWLLPVLLMLVTLIEDFSGTPTPTWALAIVILCFFVSVFYAQRLYVRGEVNALEGIALYSPAIGIWVVLVLLRALVFALIGRPI